MTSEKKYPAKLLLFGEHVLLIGAGALAVPAPAFFGQWSKRPGLVSPELYREATMAFVESLARREDQIIDVDAIRADIRSGILFESNIPVGYGLGSSGALVAGVYDVYAQQKTSDLNELKAILGDLEGFFHAKSSGIDPLTSYLNRAVGVKNRTEVFLPEQASWAEQPCVALLDTRLPRQTGVLVAWFLQQYETPAWRIQLEQQYLPALEQLRESWLSANTETFWSAMARVSHFQLNHFIPMVPENIRSLWQRGLASGDFFVKICGAGGGGYMLVFARNHAILNDTMEGHPLVFPWAI